MLENMKLMLKKAEDLKQAVPEFNISNLEWARFILETCQELNTPVILGVTENTKKYIGGFYTVSCLVRSLMKDLKITIPVALHLDHGTSYESCVEAINNGFTSVMIDASYSDIETNINVTKKVVEYAHARNVTVEAEVGIIGKNYTDISDAIRLMQETKADFLAPSLGNIHGIYESEPSLDYDKMLEIHNAINVPLVLHGGSGLNSEAIKKAISCGVSKININTELQLAWSFAVRQFLFDNEIVYDPRKIIKSGENAIKQIIKQKVKLFRS